MMFTCVMCGESKVRNRAGIAGGQADFKDEHGKSWARRKCPACKNKVLRELRRKNYVKKERKPKYDVHVGHTIIYVDPKTKQRNCARCNEKTVNYNLCNNCWRKNQRDNADAYANESFYEMWGI